MAQTQPLTDVLDSLNDQIEGDKTKLGDLLDAFEGRSLGMLLTLLGLVAVIPVLGGIPGVSVLVASLIIVAVAQSFLANGGIWAPRLFRRMEIDNDKMERAVEKARSWTGRLDAIIRPRMPFLVEGRFAFSAIAFCSVLLAMTFYPMALVPGGVTVPALAILAFGIALMGRDGAFAFAGYGFTALSAGLAYWFL